MIFTLRRLPLFPDKQDSGRVVWCYFTSCESVAFVRTSFKEFLLLHSERYVASLAEKCSSLLRLRNTKQNLTDVCNVDTNMLSDCISQRSFMLIE